MLAFMMVFAVPGGGPFGEVSAIGEVGPTDTVVVMFRVEAAAGNSVVAHIIDPGNTQEMVTLSETDVGVYTGEATTEVADLIVVFEMLDIGTSQLSAPHTFTELGVDPLVLGYPTEVPVGDPTEDSVREISPENRRLLWIAVALIASSLSLVAFWVAGPKPKQDGTSESDEEE